MGKNILIVEDSETAATALEIALSEIPGVSVLRAADGRRAWEYLTADSGHQIDAVVTDLEVPLVDGFELIRRVRERDGFVSLPIVVLSGQSDPQASERVLQLGANAYFRKPWSAREIKERMENLLNSSEGRAP